MKFLTNVLKTLSTLGLHAEKKDKFPTVFQNISFINQFMNCFITGRGKMYFLLVFEVIRRTCFALTPATPFIVPSTLLLVGF